MHPDVNISNPARSAHLHPPAGPGWAFTDGRGGCQRSRVAALWSFLQVRLRESGVWRSQRRLVGFCNLRGLLQKHEFGISMSNLFASEESLLQSDLYGHRWT